MSPKFTHIREEYLSNDRATKLHTVDIWNRDSEAPEGSCWVIFIHGGAWRDPDNSSLDFVPALELLSTSPTSDGIAGFASINYRLSPYPSHSTNPSYPDDPSRNAIHRDHVYDVSQALSFLWRRYSIRTYLLVGHSAGATIAFQLPSEQDHGLGIIPIPTGILGVEGIYDLEQFVKSFEDIPTYREIVVNAFEDDTVLWKRASPTSMWKPALWMNVSAIIIAHSDEDELVDRKQAELMLECTRSLPKMRNRVHFLQPSGSHNDIVSQGHELARLIEEALILI